MPYVTGQKVWITIRSMVEERWVCLDNRDVFKDRDMMVLHTNSRPDTWGFRTNDKVLEVNDKRVFGDEVAAYEEMRKKQLQKAKNFALLHEDKMLAIARKLQELRSKKT